MARTAADVLVDRLSMMEALRTRRDRIRDANRTNREVRTWSRRRATMADATSIRVGSPAYQAYQILHVAFVVAPVVAGIDKFSHFLANWDAYLAPVIARTVGITAHSFMLGVGVIEILAGIIVAFAPRIGAWIV